LRKAKNEDGAPAIDPAFIRRGLQVRA
jgi:hypothetical protein